jgi:hypothetical protein
MALRQHNRSGWNGSGVLPRPDQFNRTVWKFNQIDVGQEIAGQGVGKPFTFDPDFVNPSPIKALTHGDEANALRKAKLSDLQVQSDIVGAKDDCSFHG